MSNTLNVVRIDLADELAPSISTRVAIQALKKKLEPLSNSRIILDFANVHSVSRSAAHELVSTRFELTNIDRMKVDFENMRPSVSALFATVTDNTINAKPKDRAVATKSVSFNDLRAKSFAD